ncbi:hypothetical protein EVAR_5687_1 [Eumeta japonica]|uniref:Uncharacterized protein n=1 Tax=Eumeta variegata TaxID=151549 RepID=A0A4C1T878_EUMVA|nr:hypothetical protein EVAR_5687_1 [Eumeta japonica]
MSVVSCGSMGNECHLVLKDKTTISIRSQYDLISSIKTKDSAPTDHSVGMGSTNGSVEGRRRGVKGRFGLRTQHLRIIEQERAAPTDTSGKGDTARRSA